MISRRGRKGRRMKKLQSVIVLLILVLTIFSSFNFIAQPVSASPPLSGDKAFANASVSYTYINHWQQQPATTLRLWATNNTTATSIDITSSYPGISVSGSNNQWWAETIPLSFYTYNGTVDLRINGELQGSPGSATDFKTGGGTITYSGLNYVWANLTAGGTTYVWNYHFGTNGQGGDQVFVFAPEWNVSAGVEVTQLTITETDVADSGNEGSVAPSDITTVLVSNIGVNEYGTSGTQQSAEDFIYGWNYNSRSISSSFSLPSNLVSYEVNWTAQLNTNAIYNSVTESGATSGHFTGSSSVTSITFQADIVTGSQNSYLISYFLNQNTTSQSTYSYGEEAYTYSIGENGNFFNSTPIYFNYTLPSTASTSYSASYSLKISNLTLTNPSAPVDSLSLVAPSFTYYSLSKYKSTYNVTAYQNYSTAQNAYIKFSTSELVNYYPTVNYDIVKWTGTGSKAELIVNASNVGGGYIFSSESFQILNINWGDGSALQSSSEQTGSYNWTLYHYYSATSSFSVSFQIENLVGNSNALSTSKTLTYQITVGITAAPANGAVLGKDQKVFFNWTDTNAGMTSVRLTIDSLVQQTNTYSSLLVGSFNFTPSYLGLLTVSWYWIAGNISGYYNLSYTTSTVVDPLGLYVIFNWTLSGTTYSNYWYSPPDEQYNQTWWYYDFTITIPNGSILQTVKGANNWIFDTAAPGLYVYYENNASVHFYQKATTYQVVFIAPLPPTSAYFTIKLEDAAGNTIGASGASFESFNVFVDGKPTSSDIVNAQTGETYNVKVYSEPFNTLLSNSNFTVQYQVSEDVIQLDVYPLAVQNLNQSHYVLFTVEQNGQSLPIQFIGLGAEKDFSIVAGTYYFNFTQYSLGNVAGATISRLTTISGPSIQFISGTTLAQISSEQKNISTQINNVNITFYAGNSKLYNETLRINASIVNTNSSIVKQVLDENTTINNIYSKVQSINSAVYVIQNNIMSDINSTRVNVTTKETTIKDLVSLSLQEENSTFSYQLKFGTPSVQGETYEFPVFVTLFNGQMANLSVTQQAWQNLKLYYVTGNQTHPLNFSVSNEQAGSFVINIYNVTPAMAAGMSSGQGLITAQGEVKEGVLTNLAAGIIGSQQVQYSSSNLWTDIFGIQPPNANDSVSGMFQYLSWLDESYAGRAIYMIVVLSALTYYLVMINMKLEERRKKK